jgi:hypothetical protein
MSLNVIKVSTAIALGLAAALLAGELNFSVGRAGLEPATPRPPVWCATKLRHRPVRPRP